MVLIWGAVEHMDHLRFLGWELLPALPWELLGCANGNLSLPRAVPSCTGWRAPKQDRKMGEKWLYSNRALWEGWGHLQIPGGGC